MHVTDLDAAPIDEFETLDSTMSKAGESAQIDFQEGHAVLANTQSSGRGRHGRQWISSSGGLWATLLFRPQRPLEEWPSLGLTFAVSLAETIENYTKSKVSVKWPNDLWCDGAKLAGILLEQHSSAGAVALGFGVNFDTPNAESPDTLRHPAIGLSALVDHPPSPKDLLQEIRRQFSARYNGWNLGQFAPTQEAFAVRDLLHDEHITWSDDSGTHEGRALGIDNLGRLKVGYSDGAQGYLSAGEVERMSARPSSP